MIEKVLSFISEHIDLCISFVLALIILVLQLFKKKPVKVIDGLYSALIKALPGFIVYAEKLIGDGKGDEKLDKVVELSIAYINKLYPGIKDLTPLLDFVKSQVEIILSTPQKKKGD